MGRLSFLVIFLAACNTVETARVESPLSGRISSATYKLFQKEREVEVHYPNGVRPTPVDLHFTESNGRLAVGVDRNSPFVVEQMEQVTINSEKIVRIFLQRNHYVLPVFSQPPKIEFESKVAFRGMGRIYRAGIDGADLTKRNGGLCNAVLVKQDQALTASHCISTQLECDNSWFIIWDGASYANYACKKLLLTKRGADQSLILLEKPVHKIFSPINVEADEWYFPNGTPLVVGSDFSEWSINEKKKLELQKETGTKKLLPCKVLGSFYSMNSSNGSELVKGVAPSERVGEAKRLTNYAVDCEFFPGQSGSGVFSLKGTIVGLVVAEESRFTPIDPEISLLLR